MVKMVSLKKSAADRLAEKDAMGSRDVISVPAENEGVTVNLDHHHLMNMEHEGDEQADPRGELKGELRKAVAGSERAKSDQADNKTDKAGASGKKLAE